MRTKIISLALLFLMVAAIIYLFTFESTEPIDEPEPIELPTDFELVAVNGVSINRSHVDKEWTTIPVDQRSQLTNLIVLEFLIDKQILLQAAILEGTTLTDEEVLAAMESLDEHALYNLTREEHQTRLFEQALINEYLEDATRSNYFVPGELVREYYANFNETYAAQNISFEEAELDIIDILTEAKRRSDREAVIQQLRNSAQIDFIVR